MYIPKTTYRIQFTSSFTFKDLVKHLPYLEKLGVDTIYASPVFQARPGSTHGYDVTDFSRLNPELGTEDDFKLLIETLHRNNMGWIQDIVPNHMAYSLENEYIVDVLKNGTASLHSHLFDIFWDHHDPEISGKLMVPVLGGELSELIENDELSLVYRNGEFFLNYYENNFPINTASVDKILAIGRQEGIVEGQDLSENSPDAMRKLSRQINLQARLIQEIADMQYYLLCHWQTTEKKINYRRFFTVNDLICIRQEDDEVFEITHQLIADYYKKGYFQGVRVDHIDGLLKPTEYLHNLRELLGNNAYILVEKILGKDEKLPSNWPVQGTTGYDYLGAVNELLIKKANTEVFTNIYHTYIGGDINYLTMVERKKRFILRKRMAGELENLLYLLQGSSANTDEAFNYREAVTYLLSLFPIYRTYIENDSHKGWHAIYEDTAGKIAGFENEISELKKVFSLQSPKDIQFVLRFQQLSGPLAAKGVEDTAFYQYNRFIGQNEVGDEPLSFGETTEKFHQYILERKESWPLAMNNSSTHDTKRGEDARARLAAVSGDTQSWSNFVDHISEQTGSAGPTPNDRYMILQSIVGAWPANGNLEENFNQRFQEFLQKALREGKNQTSWASPNLQYENVCFSYYKSLLEKEKTKQIISEYVSKLIRPGFLNSINTLILKFTLPGIPDIYQGCESWNFSFVDPDNRRPVDYEKFNRVLDEIHSVNEKETTADFIEELWQTPADETLKIALTQKLVQLRRAEAELLTNGEYIPVETNTDAIAYFRTNEYQWLFVFLSFGEEVAFNADKIKFPGGAPEKWTDIFTQESGGMNEIKQNFPFICLKGDL